MARQGGKPKDPQKYMQWRQDMIQKYGQDVFAAFDVMLPDGYETLRASEQDAVDNNVSELIYNMNKEYQSQNEDFIVESGLDSFVNDEDWKALNADQPMTSGIHHFKMFDGKNYTLEFIRQDDQIFFHFYYPAPMIKAQADVYDRMEEIMGPIIPRHWKVSMSLDTKVMPHNTSRLSKKLGDYPTCSSYSVHFIDGANMENALHYINKALKAFLKEFLMPQHNTVDI